MRNWINITEHFAKQAEDILSEDLDFEKIEDNKIVLDDPENDEVEALKKDSPEKKDEVLKDVSKAMHEEEELDEARYSYKHRDEHIGDLSAGIDDEFDSENDNEIVKAAKGDRWTPYRADRSLEIQESLKSALNDLGSAIIENEGNDDL